MRLLEEVQGSTLLLLAQGNATDGHLLSRTPPPLRSRVHFQPFLDVRRHLARIRQCDLALDTYGISGHTTSANYLWGGVPIVTSASSSWAGRVTSSLLAALAVSCPTALLGIARSESDFLDVARRLARSARGAAGRKRRLLDELRACMAGGSGGREEGGEARLNRLFDSQRWVEGWERVLRMMLESKGSSVDPLHIVMAWGS
eukprot:667417-Hanusia_phi.AAC.4